MIRLHRPAKPQVLADKATTETDILMAAFNSGKPIVVKQAIYGHQEVKESLKRAQHNKCAYCETLDIRSHWVVEHYRPKSGWRQNKPDKLQQPEYFWLAYDWNNLLFACDICNDAGHKQNLFPLADPSKRATAANPDTSLELPLLINPYENDPSVDIEWHRWVPVPRNGSIRGRVTIDAFGLDRDVDLMDKRTDYYQLLDLLVAAAERITPLEPIRIALRDTLQANLRDEAPYAAMIRENFGARIAAL